MSRSKSIETLLPILYLKGVSTGDFSEALAALLGKDAAGLSASAIGRLKDGWQDDHAAWSKRDLSAKRYQERTQRRAGRGIAIKPLARMRIRHDLPGNRHQIVHLDALHACCRE